MDIDKEEEKEEEEWPGAQCIVEGDAEKEEIVEHLKGKKAEKQDW